MNTKKLSKYLLYTLSVLLLLCSLCLVLNTFSKQQQANQSQAELDDLTEQLHQSIGRRELIPGTRLRSYAVFCNRLDTLLLKPIEPSKCHILVEFDGDNFGVLNETYGKLAVDSIVANMLRAFDRRFASRGLEVCKLSERSDELFVLYMNVDDPKKVEQEVSDYLDEIRNTEVTFPGGTLKATVSAGLAVFPKDAHDTYSLNYCVDKALQDAKDAGKDRYQFYTR